MLAIFYQRFKLWFWLLLGLATGTGAISKSYHGQPWEVILNGLIALISFIVFVRLLLKSRSAKPSLRTGKDSVRLSLYFTIAGALAAALMLPYQLDAGLLDVVTEKYGVTVGTASMLAILQTALLTLIASFIGLSISNQVNLGAPILRGQSSFSGLWIGIAVMGSAVGTFVVALLEVYQFQPRISVSTIVDVSAWKLSLIMFYGGIVEEILLRLGLMTVIVWVLSRPYRNKGANIPPFIYWISILSAAILFGLAHLPATVTAFGSISAVVVVRALVLNGLLGIFFGYLYWRKGIEYSMIAHMCADLFLHVVWFQVFN